MTEIMLLCSLFSLFILHLSSGNLEPGDLCQDDEVTAGVCRIINECPSAIQDLREKKRPKTCSFDGNIPIVCCRRDDVNQPTPKPVPINVPENPEFGKVSSEKCKNYAGLVFRNISSPTLLIDVLFEIEDTCGIKKENYNDSAVLAREFPHLASIGYDSKSGQVWKCAGTLISEQFVLTAATCSRLPMLGLAKYVRVGSNSVRTNFYNEKPLQYTNIKTFIKHPQFNQTTRSSNLALIELETPVMFTSIVRPACLRLSPKRPQQAINVGWGTFISNAYLNNEPLKSLVRIIGEQNCNGLKGNQFCVEQVPGSLWQSCLADRGSPLQVYNGDNLYCAYDIIGIASNWRDCSKNRPGIYTNISAYIPWIEKTVWG